MSSGNSSTTSRPASALEPPGFFEGGGLEEQLETYRKKQRRHVRHLLTMTVCFAAVIWFLWGLVDQARYEFQVTPIPTAVGDIVEVGSNALAHNTYISLEGITEHRGLSQKLIRDLSFNRQEYWYFRLLGSGGVFIEVPPDADKFGIATKVAVTGRVIDPARDSAYERLLEVYGDRFLGDTKSVRIIQVGRVPGESRMGFYVALGILVLLIFSNLRSLRGLLRAREEMAHGIIG